MDSGHLLQTLPADANSGLNSAYNRRYRSQESGRALKPLPGIFVKEQLNECDGWLGDIFKELKG
jgi:hypothetical protein